MCINPSFVWVKRGPKWEKVPAPCDRCKLCRENYVSDWVGRCLCEASTSQIACTVNLTYAEPDDWRDVSHKVVNPHHFQLFVKRLRNAGHKVRYLVAGEYGETRDRAHFHCILFFSDLRPSPDGRVPRLERAKHKADPRSCAAFCREIPQEEMVNISEWPHGHITVDWSVTDRSVRYCVEYLHGPNKKNGWRSESKKPALGAAWFAQKAAQAVDLDVLPSTFEYFPPGGKPGKKYLMTGATRRDYLNAITRESEKRSRMSEWVGKTFDKLQREAFIKATEAAAPWPDDYFSSRQPSVEAVKARLADEDEFGEGGWRGQAARIAASDAAVGRLPHPVGRVRVWSSPNKPDERFWNVPQTHLFYQAACAFNLRGEPGFFNAKWVEQYFQSGYGSARFRARYAAHCKIPPSGFDRQGEPYWGDPKNPPLGGVFERPAEPDGNPDGTSADE